MSSSGKLLFLFIIFLAFACDGKEKSQPREMQFEVKDELLGKNFHFNEFNLEMKVPVGWKKFDTSISDLMERLPENKAMDTNLIRQTKIFANKENGCFLIIAMSREETVPENVFELMKNNLMNDHGDNLKSSSVFLKDGIKFYQFLISNKKHAIFKLLFFPTEEKMIQMDYKLPLSIYKDEIKSVESSIGSINIIN